MSIKLRLFLILTASTLVVWLSAVIWIEHVTRAQVEKVLDARLMEAARMVASLVESGGVQQERAPSVIKGGLSKGPGYSQQQFCQIWSLNGQMIGRSEDAPGGQLLEFTQSGFHEVTSQGKALRVYAIVNPDLGIQVTVGDSLEMRDRLIHGVVEGLALPALVVLPLMGALIWWSTRRGLKPLDRLAQTLGRRHVEDAAQIPTAPATPREIQPVLSALNELLGRLNRARQREKDFVSYAAHEMKTPLAGLKIQAYVARHTLDDAARQKALEAIEYSVSRTDRMVRQLLDLAQIENRNLHLQQVDLAMIARQQIIALTELADRSGVTCELETLGSCQLSSDPFFLGLALRNLIENAIYASPKDERIIVRVETTATSFHIAVIDQGEGLPAAIGARLGERFLSNATNVCTGSGLGLAITFDALTILGCQLTFDRTPLGHRAHISNADLYDLPRDFSSMRAS
ncbi:HAMP domain-containing protein [Rhodobacteraceae bacterium]|nr:HAMP domain-containing protein [Paracoccaceae bacterium]